MSYVYFIQDERENIKIGRSDDPPRRMQTVPILGAGMLKLLAYYPGDQWEEKRLHKRFERHRIEGEWFSPGEELVQYISELPQCQECACSRTKRVNPEFGVWVQQRREAASLTQLQAAETSGVPIGTLREIEQGRREPLFSTMQKLASCLGITDLNESPNPVEE